MRRPTFIVVAFCLVLSASAAAQPVGQDPTRAPKGDYVLDRRQATLVARMKQFGGLSRLNLRFDRLEGAFSYDPDNWTATKVEVAVDPASVRTGSSAFDRAVAGPRYLNATKYPTIVFVSTSATGAEGRGAVNGDLTLLGRTRPVTLDVRFNGYSPRSPGGDTRMVFSGRGRIKRSDFGLKAPLNVVSNDVDLVFEVEFVRK